MIEKEILHFHLFCGLGGGAKGFNKGSARVKNLRAKFRCIGGIDVDPASIADFDRMAGATGTVLDLFSREQYAAFHGREPGPDWREATTADIHRAAGHERPHIIFLSAPCKGFSGLLSESRSKTGKYQALNALTLRGVWLALEAFKNDPVELFVFENVPRIRNRGRQLLDQITALFRSYGYAVAETTHDCGELGGLAQSRKRFLLVARHEQKVPPFLYEPEKRALRGVGTVLERLPVPGGDAGGAMHRLPRLQWKTWVRLAFVEAGSDWRSLNRLRIVDGMLADYLIMPECHNGHMGVNHWSEPAGTVAARSRPGNGNFSVADPRIGGEEYSQFGVKTWDETAATVTGARAPGQGRFSVADPRHLGPPKHANEFRIVKWENHSMAVTGAHGSGQCVADPRGPNNDSGKHKITNWEDPSGTVIAGDSYGAYGVADPRGANVDSGCYTITEWNKESGSVVGCSKHGAYGVADPRPDWNDRHGHLAVMGWDRECKTVLAGGKGVQGGYLSVSDPRPMKREKGDAYFGGGHYGVIPWAHHAPTISAAGKHDNGYNSVADPRMPEADEKLQCVIRALDGTWHRPFTTLELAALQSLVDPEEYLELAGLSDGAWRERIGNAVPPAAAAAIASVMGTTLLLAWSGETFMLSSTPIWVRDVAVGLSVQSGGVT